MIDRSFKTPAPECLERLAPVVVKDGVTWGGLVIDLGSSIKERDICFAQVAAWVTSEKLADGNATTGNTANGNTGAK